jgi:hypothetical protein
MTSAGRSYTPARGCQERPSAAVTRAADAWHLPHAGQTIQGDTAVSCLGVRQTPVATRGYSAALGMSAVTRAALTQERPWLPPSPARSCRWPRRPTSSRSPPRPCAATSPTGTSTPYGSGARRCGSSSTRSRGYRRAPGWRVAPDWMSVREGLDLLLSGNRRRWLGDRKCTPGRLAGCRQGPLHDAPPVGLEPTTCRLTAGCSAN